MRHASRGPGAADSERLVHGRKYLSCLQLIEAPTVALQVALAAKLAARQAMQRVLHDPRVPALLNGSRRRPTLVEPANRPGSDPVRPLRSIDRNRRGTGGGGQVRHRGVRTDIYGRPAQQGDEL